jgi:hypothetical protein
MTQKQFIVIVPVEFMGKRFGIFTVKRIARYFIDRFLLLG